MTTLVLRQMTIDDLPEVVTLESANRAQPWTEGVFRDELSAPGRSYVVACEPNIVGYGGVMVVADEVHVTNLLVTPHLRGRGIGKTLMSRLVSEAVAGGAKHLTLEVRASNEPALRLYSSLGMAPVGVRPRYYGSEDALILWAHDIDDPAFLERLA